MVVWYYSLGVSSIVDAFVRSESRVDGRSYLHSGAIDGSEENGIIRDPKPPVHLRGRENVDVVRGVDEVRTTFGRDVGNPWAIEEAFTDNGFYPSIGADTMVVLG
ncbi:hypothetical protein Tco_0121889 [Tanacetum coccineum]